MVKNILLNCAACIALPKLQELIYVESHLSNTSAKFYGEITQQMLKNSNFPGSNNGTGLLQTIIGLKVRANTHLPQQRPWGLCGQCCALLRSNDWFHVM